MFDEDFAAFVLSEIKTGRQMPPACPPWAIPPPPPPPPSPSFCDIPSTKDASGTSQSTVSDYFLSSQASRPIKALPRPRRPPSLELTTPQGPATPSISTWYAGQAPALAEEPLPHWHKVIQQAIERTPSRYFSGTSTWIRRQLPDTQPDREAHLSGQPDLPKDNSTISVRQTLSTICSASIISQTTPARGEEDTSAGPIDGDRGVEATRCALATLFLAADAPTLVASDHNEKSSSEYPGEYYSDDEEDYFGGDEDSSREIDELDEDDDEFYLSLRAEMLKRMAKENTKEVNDGVVSPPMDFPTLLWKLELEERAKQEAEQHRPLQESEEEYSDDSDKENIWIYSDSDRSNKENHPQYFESNSEDKENYDFYGRSDKENDKNSTTNYEVHQSEEIEEEKENKVIN